MQSDVDAAAERIIAAIEFDDSDPFGPQWSIRPDAPTIGLQEQYTVANAYIADRAARQALERDAARYRCVRQGGVESPFMVICSENGEIFEEGDLDAAIDAAIQQDAKNSR